MKFGYIFSFILILLFSGQTKAQKWQTLFDGKSLKGWKQITGKANYTVVNGVLTGTMAASRFNSFLASEKEYSDFILEMEFRIQDTTINSGVQFRSHINPAGNEGTGQVYGYQYEFDPSYRKWTAGIYDEARRLWLYPLTSNPAAMNSLQPGVFHKLRIECIGSEMITFLNGQVCAYISDTVDLSGFIALQVHGTSEANAGKKVEWKNIKIATKRIKLTPVKDEIFVVNLCPIRSISTKKVKDGLYYLTAKLLLAGKVRTSLHFLSWMEIKDGELTVLSSAGKESANGGDIVSLAKYSAFDLSFDFKLQPGANSGLKYFVTLSENNTGSAIGLEYQLLDDKLHPDAKMGKDGNRTLGSLYDLITANKNERFFRPPGNWNRGRIVVHPTNHVEHFLNGIKVLEYERGSQTYKELVATSKYKIWDRFGEAKEGHILIQDHGDEVNFRSIKIRNLTK